MLKNGKGAIPVEMVLDTVKDKGVELEYKISMRRRVAPSPKFKN